MVNLKELRFVQNAYVLAKLIEYKDKALRRFLFCLYKLHLGEMGVSCDFNVPLGIAFGDVAS